MGSEEAKASYKVCCLYLSACKAALFYFEPLSDGLLVLPLADLLYACLCSFSDSIRRRCSVLQWNPDVATQLIIASDEDSSPSLRVRNIYVLSTVY